MKKLIYVFYIFLFCFFSFTKVNFDFEFCLENMKKKINFIAQVQKNIKDKDGEDSKNDSSLIETCDSINFLDTKIIVEEFYQEKFDRLQFLIDEMSVKINNENFSEEEFLKEEGERLRSVIFFITIFEYYLLKRIIIKREFYSFLKIGYEISFLLYDLSKISIEKLLRILEIYHHELLAILKNYLKDDNSCYVAEQKDKLGLMEVLKKLKNKKPWVFFTLFSFFVYGFYNYKSSN